MITVLYFLLFPIFSIIINFVFYFANTKSHGIMYSILLGISIGIIFYHFIPPQTYDLYRHHLKVINFYGYSVPEFIKFAKYSRTEFLPLLICYFASIFKNKDIIQLFVVSLGYSIIFYLLYDYRKKTNLNILVFVFIFLFTVFGFNIIYFVSGLWFYIAAIIFSLAFYLDYEKKINKVICYILYFIPLLFHNSMLFAILLVLIYKLFKNKISFKIIIISFAGFFFSSVILEYMNSIFSSKILSTVLNVYNTYLQFNDSFKYLYDGGVFFIEITKLLVIILSIVFLNKKNKLEGAYGFIILLTVCTLLLMTKSIVMIRFIMIIQLIGIKPLCDVFKEKEKYKIILFLLLAMFSFSYIYYSYYMLSYQNFGNLDSLIFENVFNVFNK